MRDSVLDSVLAGYKRNMILIIDSKKIKVFAGYS